MAKDEKSSKKTKRDRNRDKPPTKIVIRHLPPTMTEEEFLKQIDPLPEHDFYYFAAADWSLGFDATCRAYITLKNPKDVFLFRDRFDGYVFVDNKGNEYAAIVEFAPFQGFLKNKSRNSDSKVNTIEQESHYQQFLKKLEEDREAAAKGGESKLEFSLNPKKEEITSTPLLQYLANKREKHREESKKRTAEKKKRREEEKEKEKRKQAAPTPSQPVKVLTSDNSNKAADNAEQKPKNARARRRDERNRLRHEAYLQKKKAQKEMQNTKDTEPAKTTSTEDASQGKAKAEEGKPLETSLKESDVKATSSSAEPNKPIEILKKSKAVDMLTESVRNFIITAANTLTVPPATTATDGQADKVTGSNSDANKCKEDLDKSHESSHKSDVSQIKAATGELDNDSKEFLASLTEKQREERREERRIRNKDRPSIAIYQPKPRLRLSEESDSNSTSKDVRSLSQSDCETAKKDEQPRHKKVQRYSERSKNRRKSTTKDAGSEDDSQAAA